MTTTRKNLYTAALILIALLVIVIATCRSRAQKPEPRYSLNAQAAKVWESLSQDEVNEETRHKAKLSEIGNLRAALLIGAGIPEAEWSKRVFKAEADGTLSFVVKPSPSP